MTYLFVLLFFALAAHGQQERIAIIQTVDDGDSAKINFSELAHLTDKLRETAVNILPKPRYGVMTTESIVAFLGSQERMTKECKAASCLAELGRKVNADYVAQARIGRFESDLTIKAELYNSKSGNLIGSFTGDSKSLRGLRSIIDEKAPALFKKMPGASGGSKAASISVEGGISGFEKAAVDYEMDDERRHVANLSTEPAGATLSFNGVPIASCSETPCKAELGEGTVRIIAALAQYETADTTVSIRQNNQSINIRLKPNFGVLEIKPAYSDGIGSDRGWSLTINGKEQSSYENRFSQGNYEVRLSHECYEGISFKAGINKGSREVFDMAGKITLKKGGLSLSADRDGEPASEPVFVNGKQVGETPFSGTVPVCAKVEIGYGREAVDAKLKYNEKIRHTHSLYSKSRGGKPFTDSRDGKKYRTVAIGTQTWMAENLNYNASGSKCYKNSESNCQKYGRLYNWNTAKTACPSGWHLPSKSEWEVLTVAVGGEKTEGKYLKAASGWNNNGNGTDTYDFAALPGGYGFSDGDFGNAYDNGNWWSASEYDADYAYDRSMYYYDEDAHWGYDSKSGLFSVRCVIGSPSTAMEAKEREWQRAAERERQWAAEREQRRAAEREWQQTARKTEEHEQIEEKAMIGYQYLYKMPFGVRWSSGWFYNTLNFRIPDFGEWSEDYENFYLASPDKIFSSWIAEYRHSGGYTDYAFEWVVGYIWRPFYWLGIFGGGGFRHTEEYRRYDIYDKDYDGKYSFSDTKWVSANELRYDFTYELGLEFVFERLAAYISARNFSYTGGGIGIIF
jgi:uncharacterized protein (TIGR02145 family)